MFSNLERTVFIVIILLLSAAINEKTNSQLRLDSTSASGITNSYQAQLVNAANKKCDSAPKPKLKSELYPTN